MKIVNLPVCVHYCNDKEFYFITHGFISFNLCDVKRFLEL